MAKRHFLVVPVLLYLIASLAYGQTQTQTTINRTATIIGSIILPTNQAMQRYEILLLSKDGEQELAHTYTDLTGRYSFANLTASNCDVVVRIEGFEEYRETVYLSPNRTATVNVIMTVSAAVPNIFDSRVVNIDDLTRKFPKKAVDDFQKAQESKKRGDLMKAMELLEGVVKLTPDFSDAHNVLGAIYQSMDRYRDAEKQYNLARNLSPDSVTPLVNLATLYLQEAEANAKDGPYVTGVMYDDALHVLQEASKIDSHSATIFYLFGITFYRSRSYRIAEASFIQALAIDERLSSARLALANVYIHQQKWKDALNQFDLYLAQNPKAADRGQVEAIRIKVIQQL
jgi:tetratricopeptide (TPR) repeat protein